MTSVNIPSSVKTIEYAAFAYCKNLANIIVDENNIIYDSRENCNAIIETATNTLIVGCKNTIIPNSVISIGNYAFYGCTSLTSLTIPNSVTNIGNSAFDGCTSLTSLTIPNSVTNIGDYAFYGCTSLTSLTIPNSVTNIGYYAFYGCTNLKTVLNLSVLKIGKGSSGNGYLGYYAITVVNFDYKRHEFYDDFIFRNEDNRRFYLFAYMGEDDNPSLPESYKGKMYELDDRAFQGFTGLTDVIIPDSVTSIGNETFEGCSNLTNIQIPNSVTSIGDYAFEDCTSLISFTIPNSVTCIGYGTFLNCTNLTNIHIGNSVKELSPQAFQGCTSLVHVTIGLSLEKIGNSVFVDCNKLETLMLGSPVPPTVDSNNFSNYNYIYTTLYVPKGTLAAYQAADVWKNFLYMEEYDIRGIENIQMDTDIAPIYNLQGVQMEETKESLPSGIYIQDGKKFIVK